MDLFFQHILQMLILDCRTREHFIPCFSPWLCLSICLNLVCSSSPIQNCCLPEHANKLTAKLHIHPLLTERQKKWLSIEPSHYQTEPLSSLKWLLGLLKQEQMSSQWMYLEPISHTYSQVLAIMSTLICISAYLFCFSFLYRLIGNKLGPHKRCQDMPGLLRSAAAGGVPEESMCGSVFIKKCMQLLMYSLVFHCGKELYY